MVHNWALLSVFSNIIVIAIKITVGLWTRSFSIISEAIHSFIDLIAALIAYISIKISRIPADKEHPFGHERIETMSAFIEAFLILTTAAFIFIESIKKILNPTDIHNLKFGIYTMFFCALINLIIGIILNIKANKNHSSALKADALHLLTDVYTALGVGIGLLLINWTKIYAIDGIIALIISLFISYKAFEILKPAYLELTDYNISDADRKKIDEILEKYNKDYLEYHKLRTRKSGKTIHMDLHLIVNKNNVIEDVHKLCNNIETEIKKNFKNAQIVIHPEPCDEGCEVCKQGNSEIYNLCSFNKQE